MRSLIVVIVTVIVLIAGYRWLFPDDEAQIRAVLERIADTMRSGAADESNVARLGRAATVRRHLDAQITVDADPPFDRISGREEILGALARLAGSFNLLDVELDDVKITMAEGGSSAAVHLTAAARYRRRAGEPGFDARELEIIMRKLEGEWVVAKVALIRTLKPLAPR